MEKKRKQERNKCPQRFREAGGGLVLYQGKNGGAGRAEENTKKRKKERRDRILLLTSVGIDGLNKRRRRKGHFWERAREL